MTERELHLKAILDLVPPVWRAQAADAVVALVIYETREARERLAEAIKQLG